MVFVARIEIEVVGLIGDVLAGKADAGDAVIPLDGGLFPFRAPARLHRGWHGAEAHDGLKARARHAKRSAANKRQIAVIESIAIEIADAYAGGGGAHEAIERLIDKHLRGNIDLMREVAADRALAFVEKREMAGRVPWRGQGPQR